MKPHLPKRFRPRVNELEDGSLEYLESEAEEERRQMKKYIEVRESTSDKAEAKSNEDEARREAQSKATRKQMQILRHLQKSVADNTWTVENPDPLSKNKVPISAAERRRMIKAELKRLSHNKEPVLYQRRLW